MSESFAGLTEVTIDAPTGGAFETFPVLGTVKIGKLTGSKSALSRFKTDSGADKYENHYTFLSTEGKTFTINAKKDLHDRLVKVPVGEWVVMKYVADKDIGKPNPMALFWVGHTSDPTVIKAYIAKGIATPTPVAQRVQQTLPF